MYVIEIPTSNAPALPSSAGVSVSPHPAFKPRPVHEGFDEGPYLRPGIPSAKMVGAEGTKILLVWPTCIDTNQGYINRIGADLSS
jgi:hypothetical protein